METATGRYTLKQVRGESVAASTWKKEFIARASSAGHRLREVNPEFLDEEEVKVPSRRVGELIVDNSAINREACEVYLDCSSPELSALPAKHPGF
ncbi:MAG TPA: hypothetical protein VFS54_08405 [Solirubrobacterales bacterium]|nr:hypothetical protein [Solirubrobacterales bacterium]